MTRDEPSAKPAMVVGIGAAAGGAAALGSFFQNLAEGGDLAFVVTARLGSADEIARLPQQLKAAAAAMEIVAISNRLSIDSNHVYLATTEAPVWIRDRLLRTGTERETSVGPVDHLFFSLSEELAERAVGIVLSGAGTDGTLGLKAIGDAGGMTMAQSPESASFEAMPRNAAALGVIDHVLAPGDMPAELLAYADNLVAVSGSDRERAIREGIEQIIPSIADILNQEIGHDFQHYKTTTLVRRVQRRMQVLRMASIEEYLSRVRGNREEARALFRELLIGVTAFFRDPKAFEALSQQVISEQMENRARDEPNRSWIPGCIALLVGRQQASAKEAGIETGAMIERLEAELQSTREDLAKSVQDLEAANQELKSSNEELRSMNEELQSANEELETRKEEIQAANEALERAHADLQNVLLSTEIGVIILDDDFRIRSFTPPVMRIYNLIASDIGRPLWHQTHSVRDMPPLPDPSELSEAEPMVEHVVQTTEGRWFVRRVRPYRARDGRRDGMVVTFTDMTELTESEERLRVLADNIPDIVFRADERLDWTYVNSRFSERTGRASSLALGAGWMDCLHSEDRERTREALLLSREARKTLQVEHRVRQRDGSYRWFVTRAVPLGSGDERPWEWFGTSTDVHDVKQTQEALRHSEQQQRLALAAGELGVYEINLDDQSMVLDRRTREILGVPSETISVEEMLSRLHPEDRRAVEETLERIAKGAANGRSRVEFRTEAPDRGEIWLVANAQVQFGQTKSGLRALRLIGTVQEITDRKRAEDELRNARITAESASRAKSQFLANMSHEIRTPMTAILGYADVLAKHLWDEPEALDYVDTIRRNGRFLLEILNDVLDLSKIEADQVDIRIERFRPDSVVTEVRSLMEAQAIEKGIDLLIEFDGDLPQTIESDPNRLRQILVNLVANAIKFTERGSVRLVSRLLRESEELQFEVIDTGVGISREKRRKLFEPFAQADDSPSRRFTGSGLGLTISQRLARLLGGEIRVESDLGQGSRFQLTVAAGSLEGVPLVEPSLEIVASHAIGDRDFPRLDGRVLVVDDRREVRALAKHFLEEAGAEVETASDGRDAIDAVARAANSDEPFDLVLMDMQMPGMDGYEAVSRLRGNGFENPIIALTAHAMRGERERCIEAGCDDYASKPIDSGELVALIARYLKDPPKRPPPGDRGRVSTDREGEPVERYRILLVDDSEDLLESKRILLESRGHEVRIASSGKAALDALHGFDANVVILDLGLPDMTGYELLAKLKQLQSLRHAALLALSGRYDEADRKRSLEAGFHAHVVKPAHIDELEAIVAEIRRDHRA